MIDHVLFCGRAKELDYFRDRLCANFDSHGDLFPCCGPNHVRYAISHLDAWSNHHISVLRQTVMTDPADWAGDLSAESDQCLQDSNRFSQGMAKVQGDQDRHCVAVIRPMQEYIQLPAESVRSYENHLNANWKQVGRNLPKHEEGFNDVGWAVLCNTFKNTVGPMKPACCKLHTLNEFFDNAVASEVTHVDNKQPQQQPQQQQLQQHHQQQKQRPDSSSKGSKQGYRPSINEPADTTDGKSTQSGQTNMANQVAENIGQAYRQPRGSHQESFQDNVLEWNSRDAHLRLTQRAYALTTHQQITHSNSRTTH